MNNRELNNYIKEYVKNDKSQRAIMLTAPWGNGKSYYINKSLCPFLKQNKIGYAVISLYGITNLYDISKSIYFEIRTNNMSLKTEKANLIKIFCKTIIKNIVQVSGYDLAQSDEDLKKLYESIDLTNKLVILEDLERSSLSVLDVLGFVNNLVEQDKIKVLIVANENDILKYNEEKENDKKDKSLDEQLERYINIKEKTIGDTIKFVSNYDESIQSIIKTFNNDIFNKLLDEKNTNGISTFVNKIRKEMVDLNCYNYRSLLFACQKMDDFIKSSQRKDYDLEFIEKVFIGTIVYSLKFNNGDKKRWDNSSYISQTLGSYAYPLYRFMYDYLENHVFDFDKINSIHNDFINNKFQEDIDKELEVIYNFYFFD